ncbi:twin-arginine translocase TatA/TatE family subunit [Insolitispirillum peregrinum]|uniref:Sec-independent protein translocase protein TatA n=1 Tax=Insolitispirillum peregrinum TaxID=80876 RepID=A0A1N7IWD5_9PROT|nr:twin-arginine translocase TatA/TatE family subunit [Insolitispirillum peregrinum]SIS41347.1 sec-independent protein translocase protein TatA [Insolitispirillum peregrinum]
MGSFSIWHWIIVLVIILLLFGKNKIPGLMGDMAKGITAFKKGLKDEEASPSQPAKPIDQNTASSPVSDKDRSADKN